MDAVWSEVVSKYIETGKVPSELDDMLSTVEDGGEEAATTFVEEALECGYVSPRLLRTVSPSTFRHFKVAKLATATAEETSRTTTSASSSTMMSTSSSSSSRQQPVADDTAAQPKQQPVVHRRSSGVIKPAKLAEGGQGSIAKRPRTQESKLEAAAAVAARHKHVRRAVVMLDPGEAPPPMATKPPPKHSSDLMRQVVVLKQQEAAAASGPPAAAEAKEATSAPTEAKQQAKQAKEDAKQEQAKQQEEVEPAAAVPAPEPEEEVELTIEHFFGAKLSVLTEKNRGLLTTFMKKEPRPEGSSEKVKLHEEVTVIKNVPSTVTFSAILNWEKYTYQKARKVKKLKDDK